MRTCPRSAPPSTPNDRFDPFSSRPSSPPRLPSTPKRHLQVRTLCLKTAACFHAFMGICSCLLAGDNTKKHTLKRGLSTLMRTAETILKRHSVAKCNKQAVRRRSNAGGGRGGVHRRPYRPIHYEMWKTSNWERDASNCGRVRQRSDECALLVRSLRIAGRLSAYMLIFYGRYVE